MCYFHRKIAKIAQCWDPFASGGKPSASDYICLCRFKILFGRTLLGIKINLHILLIGILSSNLNFWAFSGLLLEPQIKFGFGLTFSWSRWIRVLNLSPLRLWYCFFFLKAFFFLSLLLAIKPNCLLKLLFSGCFSFKILFTQFFMGSQKSEHAISCNILSAIRNISAVLSNSFSNFADTLYTIQTFLYTIKEVKDNVILRPKMLMCF